MESVRFVYARVCRALMEPSGVTLGLITEGEVIRYIAGAVSDFCIGAGLTRTMSCQQIQAGQTQYVEADVLAYTQAAFAGEDYLQIQSTLDLYTGNNDWRGTPAGTSSQIRMDQQEPKKLSIYPAPSWTGPYLDLIGGSLMYGVISDAAAGTSLDIEFDTPAYGIPSGDYTSACYFNFAPAGLGALNDLCTSDYNLLLIGNDQPAIAFTHLDDKITQVPKSFLYYIAYGALAKIFVENSELKDLDRAKYCTSRFMEGMRIAQAANSDMLFDSLAAATR